MGDGTDTRVTQHKDTLYAKAGGKRKHSKSEEVLEEGKSGWTERKRLRMSLEIVERNHTGLSRIMTGPRPFPLSARGGCQRVLSRAAMWST